MTAEPQHNDGRVQAFGPRGGSAGLMVTTGAPERIGRWSAERRAERAARCRTMRWLYENVIVDTRTLQKATGNRHNAYQDIVSAGGRARWWWTSLDFATTLRHLDGDRYVPGGTRRGPARLVSDVTLPVAPKVSRPDVAAWIYRNSAESGRVICEWSGGRVRVPRMASRPRGHIRWSMSDLDALFPDATTPSPLTPLPVRKDER